MAILPVYNCFHPVMKKKAKPIEEINDEIKKLASDMFETMYQADGIGLAGNQIGKDIQIVTIDTSAGNPDREPKPIVLINPEIIYSSEDEVDYQEGCLSVPSYYEYVSRPAHVHVRYYDLDMKEINVEADEILARVMQHEIDHLHGVIFYERLTPLRRTLGKSKMKKIKRGAIVPDYAMMHHDGKLLK